MNPMTCLTSPWARILRETADPPGGGEGTPPPATNNNADFIKSIPEDVYKGNELAFKDISDVGSLAKSYVNAQRMIGYDRVPLPTDKSTPEEWNSFYTKLGRPGSAADYGLKTEGDDADPDADKAFAEAAFAAGLSKKQAAALHKWANEFGSQRSQQALEALETKEQEAIGALKKELGAAYDQKLAVAKGVVEKFGGPELKAFLDQTRLGNNPAFIKAMINIGEAVSEDGELLGVGGDRGFKLTPAEAKQRLDEQLLDKDFMAAYTDRSHPGHAEATKKRADLYAMAHPGERAA